MDVTEEIGECLRIWSEIMADLRGHAKNECLYLLHKT